MEEDLSGSSYLGKNDRSCDVLGADLLKYYHRPVKNVFDCGEIITETEESDLAVKEPVVETVYDETIKFISKSTQTDYRESDAQTDPWDPPFKVIKINKEPDVLYLKKFSYGKGLPATLLEVDYISRTRKNKGLIEQLEEAENGDAFEKKKKVLYDQIKTDWNYKTAMETQGQLQKLELMESSLVNELSNKSEKREQILKNMWNKKKEEMKRQNAKLEKKLKKEIKAVECNFLKEKQDTTSPNAFKFTKKTHESSKAYKEMSENNVDYLLNNYFLSNPEELSTVKNWLKKKQTHLKNKVPLPRLSRSTQREHLAEEAYQDILSKKRTKLPPKVYHEDYEREEIVLPTAKPEDLSEYFNVEEKKVDMVTVWQQILRGLAYQKQMLQLIAKHKDGLDIFLSEVTEQ